MLKKLQVRNYAIIDELDILFSPGLNIITGETGAGKSILIGALSLILGDRADTSVLLNNTEKCIVEGTFLAGDKPGLKTLLQSFDLDYEPELIIRREIAASGKSRAFINDTPVNLDALRKVSSLLVDLHRQFDTADLGDRDFQRQVLDALAKNQELLGRYTEKFSAMEKTRLLVKKLTDEKSDFNKEYDYQKFLFDELEAANFQPGELENAESELRMLESAEGIKSALDMAYGGLQDGEHPLVQQVKQIANQLSAYRDLMPELSELCSRIISTQIELQDISEEVSRLGDRVQFDAEKLQQLNDRLSEGYRLLKKHGVQTTDELLEIRNQLDSKLLNVLSIDEEIERQQKNLQQQLTETSALAAQLSAARQAVIKPLQQQVNALLLQVGMPNARFVVELKEGSLQRSGRDEVEFLFDGNRSDRFEPIRKVASGGELSRLMLSIKSLIAASVDLPTMIFDEIDTGISGEAARQVGIIMKELARSRQILTITHQPQIAGRADAHYFVYKDKKGKSIQTGIRLLNKEDSIHAIARMLSGEKPTAAALENARELAGG